MQGDTLYLQFWGNSSNSGSFELCVFEPTPPSYAICDSSVTLNIQPSCNYDYFTTAHAGHSGMSSPPCANYITNDVWFDVTVPASGRLILQLTNSGITNGAMAVYTGTCNNLQTYACDDNSSPNFLQPRIIIDDPTLANQTIYIRVWRNNSIYGGGFGICAFEPVLEPYQSCDSALLVMPDLNCNYQVYSNAFANNSGTTTPSCGSYIGGDVWFKTVVPASGQLAITTRNISIGNLALAIFTGGCQSLTQLDCETGNGPFFLMPEIILNDTSLAGDTLFIMGWRENSIFGGSFEMCIYEPPIPDNVDCGHAEELIVQPSCNFSSHSNRYAGTSGEGLNSCGNYAGTDVWFKFTVPSSGILTVDSSPGSANNIDFSLYTGSCGGLTEYACDASSSTFGAWMPKIIVNDPALANQVVYLQVWRHNNILGGSFNLCVYGDLVPEVLFPQSQSICAGDSIPPLSVFNGVFQYNWYDQAVGGNLLASDTNRYLPIQAGTYYVDAVNTSTLQTSARIPVELIINDNPLIVGGSDVTYCANENILPLSIPDLGVTYIWYDDSIQTNILALDTNQYQANIQGDYFVVAYDSATGCSSSKLINLIINPTPLLVNPVGYIGCDDGTYSGISIDDLGMQYNWYTDSLAGVQVGFDSPVILPSTNGTYYVEAVDPITNCMSDGRLPVDLMFYDIIVPLIAYDGDSLHSSVASSYQWYKNGIAIFQATNMSYDVTDPGMYHVVTMDNNGCEASSDTVEISTLGLTLVDKIDDFIVAPNPFNSTLSIQLTSDHLGAEIRLYSIDGKLIFKKPVTDNFMDLQTDSVGAGIYFLSLNKGNSRLTKKVVKQ